MELKLSLGQTAISAASEALQAAAERARFSFPSLLSVSVVVVVVKASDHDQDALGAVSMPVVAASD